LVESLGVTLADMVLILLIANEKEVHIRRPFTRHATRADELERLELVYKLDFIKSEGIGLFSKFINRGLRNDIAHLNFKIQEDGVIKRKNGQKTPIDIDKAISTFWQGVNNLESLFKEIGYMKELKTGEQT
jgi:hypothetical protein